MLARLQRWRRGRATPYLTAALGGILALWLVTLAVNLTPFADWAVAPLILPESGDTPDAIVVAGAGVIGACEPNHNGVQRVLLAARVWRQRGEPMVVFTGGTGSSCPVAVAMSRLAREIGLPPSAIWLETGSRSTRENAALSASLLRARGAQRIIVVTDRLHGRRAAGAFEQLGFDVGVVTVPIYAGHSDNVSMIAAGLREYAALGYYKARGWIPGRRRTDERTPAGVDDEATAVRQLPVRVANPGGPIAILGASYAQGWGLDSVRGAAVVNLGVTGQQSFELLGRFERDVLPVKPSAVILWGFVNDFFRNTPGDEAVTARVRDSFTRMAALAREHGIVPVLATELTVGPPDTLRDTLQSWVAPVLGKQSYQSRVNEAVFALNQWIVDLAAREGILLLDVHSALSAGNGLRRPAYAQQDGSHITPAGYAALSAYARPLLEDHLVVSDSGF